MSPVEINTKTITIASICGILMLYLLYANYPSKSRPARLKLHRSWKVDSFIDVPQVIENTASDVKIEERHLKFSVDGTSQPNKPKHTWNSATFVDIPEKIESVVKQIEISSRHVTFSVDGRDHHVFYRESRPKRSSSSIPVLLLHGANSDSDTWMSARTIHVLSASGYHVVALDLPGWGRSESSRIPSEKRARFLQRFIEHKHLDRPIIISPSMSGSYSIPFLMGQDPEDCNSRVRGFVPVAPVDTHLYQQAQYHRCEVPTMIVYGTKDVKLGLTATNNLRNLANSEVFPMEGATHPCYRDNPDEWHRYLYNFLLAVEHEQD